MARNIAVVGAGYWGKNLIRNFFELGALKAICDTQQDLVKSYQSQYPTVSFTNSFSKLLSDSSLKGIVIATPAEIHFNLAKQALLASKDVLVEKPLVLTLEDEVFCGPSMVFTNVINPRSNIPRMGELKATLVKKGASIGGNATIICGNTVGRYAFIGAGTVVTKDIPDYTLVYGNPARIKGWMCECGMKLEFNGDFAQCRACGRRYKTVDKNRVIRDEQLVMSPNINKKFKDEKY